MAQDKGVLADTEKTAESVAGGNTAEQVAEVVVADKSLNKDKNAFSIRTSFPYCVVVALQQQGIITEEEMALPKGKDRSKALFKGILKKCHIEYSRGKTEAQKQEDNSDKMAEYLSGLPEEQRKVALEKFIAKVNKFEKAED
jgi:hypothetical protein